MVPNKMLKGKKCELEIKNKYSSIGCKTIPTGKGSDFLALCPNKIPTFVEVKSCKSNLTPFQRKIRETIVKSGFNYTIERCGCRNLV